MRGEKVAENIKNGVDLGSPPHARGKVCANGFPPVRRMDHPRIRGEKGGVGQGTTTREGSPPHTRGKGALPGGHLSLGGITPAYAGKSNMIPTIQMKQWDHPRMRGEKKIIPCYILMALGSPPHARGKDLESPEKSTFLLCRTSDFI